MRDNAELVKALRFAFAQPCYSCVLGEKCNWGDFCFFKRSADAIEELLAKDTNAPNKWISVEERLPEINQSVLICAFGRSVGEGTYRGHDGFHHVWKMYAVAGTYWDDEVTHWMPLPTPPKEDKP